MSVDHKGLNVWNQGAYKRVNLQHQQILLSITMGLLVTKVQETPDQIGASPEGSALYIFPIGAASPPVTE